MYILVSAAVKTWWSVLHFISVLALEELFISTWMDDRCGELLLH